MVYIIGQSANQLSIYFVPTIYITLQFVDVCYVKNSFTDIHYECAYSYFSTDSFQILVARHWLEQVDTILLVLY